MKRLSILIFAIVALAQLSVPASMIWKREQTLRNGRVWKFRTVVVDPNDPFRGRYVVLDFAAETYDVAESAGVTQNEPCYVTLVEDADGFGRVERIALEPLTGDNVLRVSGAWYRYGGKQQVKFPFDRLWLDENLAPAAEKAYIESSQKGAAYATVRIRNGDAIVENLFIEGRPLREYLQSRR